MQNARCIANSTNRVPAGRVHPDTGPVAQTSKSAVSRVSNPQAQRIPAPCRLEVGDTAGLETCATNSCALPNGGRVRMRPFRPPVPASALRNASAFLYRHWSHTSQQHAHPLEQMVQSERLSQLRKPAQVATDRHLELSQHTVVTNHQSFHGHRPLLAKDGPTPRRFLQPVGSKPVRAYRMDFGTGKRGIKIVQFARTRVNEPCVSHTGLLNVFGVFGPPARRSGLNPIAVPGHVQLQSGFATRRGGEFRGRDSVLNLEPSGHTRVGFARCDCPSFGHAHP